MEDKENVLKQSHLRVETDLKAMPAILDWFEEFTDGLLQKQMVSHCQLALVEYLTSVVRHIHQDLPPTTPIEIELKLLADCLEMRVWERGISFSSLADLLAHLTERRIIY